MNYKMIGYVMGRIFLIEAALLAVPLLVALIYGEAALPYLIPIALLAVLGGPLSRRLPENTAIYAREGQIVVALSWVLMSVFGALPFVISGDIPSFVDAFFEMVSGFTTTGSTVLTDVEAMSQGLLFWRSFSHWVGGMGVLVFAMAIVPMAGGRAMHMLRAEMPGMTVDKLSSRVRDTAAILYVIYLVMTVVEVVLLLLSGLPLFDSLICAFGSAGTGGFSNRALSVGAYSNPAAEIIIGVFMMLFGVNFNVYYLVLVKKFRAALGSEELRAYLGIIAASTLIIAVNTLQLFQSFGESLRTAFFQVSSIITTTGFSTVDFNQWPTLSKSVLVALMFLGACAGSTGGGLKVCRLVILCKTALQDVRRVLHPHAVSRPRFEGKPLPDAVVQGVHIYLKFYILLFAASTLLVSLDEFDLVSTFTAVATCFNNIGPGLEKVGPMGSFADFSVFSKLILSADMLLGRLEILPILVLFSPSAWLPYHKRKNKGNR